MTARGVIKEGQRTFEPRDEEAQKRAERYVRYVVDKYQKEHEPNFKVISFVRYYR